MKKLEGISVRKGGERGKRDMSDLWYVFILLCFYSGYYLVKDMLDKKIL